jgi:hypothetical protein
LTLIKEAQPLGRNAMNVATRAKDALRSKFSGATDSDGYVRSCEENLLRGVDFAAIEADLRRGDGDELTAKFRAVHSSSALVVNCFGPFKVHLRELVLLGEQGAKRVEFEWPVPIFRGGTPPNLDVWIERETDIVAIESKLLEYLLPKHPTFSEAYERLAPPRCETCWWDVYKEARQGAATQFLDRAQLIKHYFGLNENLKKNPRVSRTLLYIFWEPVNWQTVDECKQHRSELEAFAELVSRSQIPFRWTTYNDLWEGWTAIPALAAHANLLKARYQVSL